MDPRTRSAARLTWRACAAVTLAASLPLVACTAADATPQSASPATAAALGVVAAPAAGAAVKTTPIAKASKETTTRVHLREGASSSTRSLGVIPRGHVFSTSARTANGWFKLSYAGKTGFVSPHYVRNFNAGLTKVGEKDYVTTQNGARDLWFTTRTATVTWKSLTFTVPSGTPVWKLGGAGKGKFKVNAGGYRNAVMTTTGLSRTSPAPASNTSKISLAAFKKLPVGNIPTKYLARADFSTHALIGAPAVADLNALNKAFRARFGEDLYIDLGYRSSSQQRAIYRELGGWLAAKPGTSVHEKGLSFDTPEHGAYSWNSARFAWLVANAPKYGWEHPKRVHRYTSAGKLNPAREYWHFDYVGKGK
ncbi:hypothetical protein DWB68_04650 [Galactobacter valiniphilus]|uniref:SH3b domain-containing protein n=1 Tax=Galactobacter valiniphilus TaxID=2676122 RepID=A0A399JB96_9MICC|nr:SH3 domain-containing protein [Galactobacter valiniphilus]RII42841.1 hypothetical protein DWB68_04650 [Galactobacter valiniphilus]